MPPPQDAEQGVASTQRDQPPWTAKSNHRKRISTDNELGEGQLNTGYYIIYLPILH